ncbi:MAG: AzlC family ABC transporter permease [Eggerthellales bacterium]|nr:AzlC family ABC transporter permease [Eggerthellales bacterium]
MAFTNRTHISQAFKAAVPIMLGYVAIGLPCGILCSSIGLDGVQVLLLSYLFYSGAGQFMLPNMFLAGAPLASIIASISFVNTRQMLYAASFAPYCSKASKVLSFFFAATVTDESFGVSIKEFEAGRWSPDRALMVNLFSQSSWAWSNFAGVLIGNAVGVPLAIASFAMTSIFICLMVTQRMSAENVVAMVFAAAGVFLCKLSGLGGPAILIGAVAGVVVALVFSRLVPGKGASARSAAGPGPEADQGEDRPAAAAGEAVSSSSSCAALPGAARPREADGV